MGIIRTTIFFVLTLVLSTVAYGEETQSQETPKKELVYLVSDLRIPFWDIMWRGVKSKAEALGYHATVYSAENDAKKELEYTVRAINNRVSGIIVSPTNSSACVTILKLAKKAGIPVVISDIGSDSGEYVSYISSDNRKGAYSIGKVLVEKMKALDWQDGRVGIIAIPQKRDNGQARTAGFMQALTEEGIKGGGLYQQETFSHQETYDYAKELIENNPNLRALWLQGSDRYQAALNAIRDMNREGEVLLITFDAEPVFLELIPKGVLVGAGMQQPYLMGEKSVESMHLYLQGEAVVKNQKLEVLAISSKNIQQQLPTIRRNVLGLGQ